MSGGGEDNVRGTRKHFVNLEPGCKAGAGELLEPLLWPRGGASPPRKSGKYCRSTLQPSLAISQLLPRSLISRHRQAVSVGAPPLVGRLPGRHSLQGAPALGAVHFPECEREAAGWFT